MRLNVFVIIIFVWLTFNASAETKHIRKDEPIQVPVGENSAITWGDLNTLNWKLNGAMITVVGWFALQVYESYKKSKDKTGETLQELIKAVERIEARLENTPTFRDLHSNGRER